MKNFIGYFFCLLLAVAIALMIDGSGGVMIGVILITALVVSLLIMLFMKNKISASVNCSQSLLAKGENLDVEVKVKKSTFLPTPFIEIEVASAPQLVPADKTIYRLAIAAVTDSETIRIPFKARFCGLAEVEIKRIELVDYLGLTRFKIKFDERSEKHCVRILPNIRDTGTQAEVLKTASDNSGFDDNEEETSETAIGSTGVPGYEHRAYTPGDPLKKINWKLSSKRDIFMVRLDEKLSYSSQVFVLDCPKYPDMSESDFENMDKITEGCLAMLGMLLKQGLESDFYYYIGGWQCSRISSMADLLEVQERLSYLEPASPPQRLPNEALKKGGAVCFTTVGSAHESYASALHEHPDLMVVVYENSTTALFGKNIWYMTSDFEFLKLL